MITKNIGKNTLGDNNKMSVALHDYQMSTHNLSTIFRSTLGVGLLTPFVKFVAQKGDIFDIQLRNKTLTQPTLGPMFGTYKLQHVMFFAPFRLYNSWLHNNRLGIGLKMSDIKLPMMTTKSLKAGINEFKKSSLYSYLGWKGANIKTNMTPTKNGVPLLAYLDIFKNYFANTQEDDFYMISDGGAGTEIEWFTIQGEDGIMKFNYPIDYIPLTKNTNLKSSADNVKNWRLYWASVGLQIVDSNNDITVTPVANLTANVDVDVVTLDKLTQQGAKLTRITVTSPTAYRLAFGSKLTKHKLSGLDEIRDGILAKKGNEVLHLSKGTIFTGDAGTLLDAINEAQGKELGGLICKTYDSDLMNNWIKTETIDGENGIGAITAIDINASDGKLSLDTLNLQQKVYNMLNRIAVSGGTYRDWLQTVYTAGRYIDRPETPEFIGGMTQYINFQEINSTAATEGQPLGDIASIGRGGDPVNSGKIHYQTDEPGYIMGIVAITPMIDYSQGNDFDLNFETMDDLHKPALDGIGYQDLDEELMHFATARYEGNISPSYQKHKSAGKTVAWIDYMTNYNRTYGKFAAGEELDFMVLNRRYETDREGNITDSTTYIDPSKHIEIFADTDLTSQNFWVQTAIECTKRGNYSAKQIPTF